MDIMESDVLLFMLVMKVMWSWHSFFLLKINCDSEMMTSAVLFRTFTSVQQEVQASHSVSTSSVIPLQSTSGIDFHTPERLHKIWGQEKLLKRKSDIENVDGKMLFPSIPAWQTYLCSRVDWIYLPHRYCQLCPDCGGGAEQVKQAELFCGQATFCTQSGTARWALIFVSFHWVVRHPCQWIHNINCSYVLAYAGMQLFL